MQPIYAKLLPLEIRKRKRKCLIYLVKLCTILDVFLAISQVQFYRKNEVLPGIEAVTGDVLSEKFRKFHGKTPVLESLFKRDLQACNFIKERLTHMYFPVKLAICLRGTYFEEYL